MAISLCEEGREDSDSLDRNEYTHPKDQFNSRLASHCQFYSISLSPGPGISIGDSLFGPSIESRGDLSPTQNAGIEIAHLPNGPRYIVEIFWRRSRFCQGGSILTRSTRRACPLQGEKIIPPPRLGRNTESFYHAVNPNVPNMNGSPIGWSGPIHMLPIRQ